MWSVDGNTNVHVEVMVTTVNLPTFSKGRAKKKKQNKTWKKKNKSLKTYCGMRFFQLKISFTNCNKIMRWVFFHLAYTIEFRCGMYFEY